MMFSCIFYVRKLASIWVSIPRAPCICTFENNLTIKGLVVKEEGGRNSVKKEMMRSGNSKILHKIVRDTTQKMGQRELIRVVSQTISCSTYSGIPATLDFLFNSKGKILQIRMQ